MEYYLGIDGGGTKTKVIIIDRDENILFENTSGPSSIDTVDLETTSESIQNAVQPYTETHQNLIFNGVFIGLGGIVFEHDCKTVEALVSKLPQVNKDTFIMARNDMHNALYSANSFDKGMTLICGTGMVAFGKNGNQSHKAGGWGYFEGELGSAYHLGSEAIRHCIRAYDYRLEMNEFAKAVAKKLELKKATDIIPILISYHDDRTKTAQLAQIVTQYANLGNPFAKEICDKAISEIVLAIEAVYKKLNFNQINLVIVGSLGHAMGYFKDTLHQSIKAISKNINIIDPIIDPALAAAKAAKYFSEVSYDF
jgi:N-acetylglucosamine kinase-like BadF-type ATPase